MYTTHTLILPSLLSTIYIYSNMINTYCSYAQTLGMQRCIDVRVYVSVCVDTKFFRDVY